MLSFVGEGLWKKIASIFGFVTYKCILYYSSYPWSYYILIEQPMESKHSMHSIQFSSVSQSCPTLCDLMDFSMPGLPVHHQLPEFTQTRVHWVGDAIQTSHPLSSPSPPAFNFSQHQGLFKWVSSLHQVAKVLEFQLQPQSFQWIVNWFSLGWTGWISLQSKGLSRVCFYLL